MQFIKIATNVFAALCQAAKRWHLAVGQLAQNRCYTLARLIKR